MQNNVVCCLIIIEISGHNFQASLWSNL